jgi:anionic cell wall polymer biosynthesis LytR-Cps2A-Psr (LCP) family protein
VAYNKSIGSDGGSGLKLSKGVHVIKGVQALEFVRQRHNLPNGDLDRVRRQQYFLTAAFRSVASASLVFKLNSLGDAIERNIYLDPGLHLLDLAKQMENLSANNIVGKTIPFQGFDNNSPVGSVEVVSVAKVQAFVDQVINGPASPKSTTPKAGSATSASASASSSASASASAKPAAIDSKCIN